MNLSARYLRFTRLIEKFIFIFYIRFPKTLNCRPIASLDHFLPEYLASADLVESVPTGSSKVVKVSEYLYCIFIKEFFTSITMVFRSQEFKMLAKLCQLSSEAVISLYWKKLPDLSMMPFALSVASSRRGTTLYII